MNGFENLKEIVCSKCSFKSVVRVGKIKSVICRSCGEKVYLVESGETQQATIEPTPQATEELAPSVAIKPTPQKEEPTPQILTAREEKEEKEDNDTELEEKAVTTKRKYVKRKKKD